MSQQRNAPMWVTAVLIVAGIACVIAGIVYFADPARSLPSFFPGHSGLTQHHVKHGIAAIIVAIGLWAAAWVTTGRKQTPGTDAA